MRMSQAKKHQKCEVQILDKLAIVYAATGFAGIGDE